MRKVLKRFLAYLEKERNATEATVRAYADDMMKFIEFLESRHGRGMLPGDVTEAMVREFLTFLAEKGFKRKNSASSRGRRLSTIRSFFKFTYRVGLIRSDPAVMISTSRGRGSEPSFLTVEEYKRLLQVIEKRRSEFFRLRDSSIVSMILSTGARVSELTNADVGDLSPKNKTVKLHRKGGEQQTLRLSEKLTSSLRRYMRVRRRRTRTRALFISTQDTRMSTSAVWKMIKGYCRKAKINKDRIGPHMLRHTFATTLLENGENLRTIQVLMNHKNIATTSRYPHSHNMELANAVNRIGLERGGARRQPTSGPNRKRGRAGQVIAASVEHDLKPAFPPQSRVSQAGEMTRGWFAESGKPRSPGLMLVRTTCLGSGLSTSPRETS